MSMSNFQPELPTLVPIEQIGRFIKDPAYGLQEKYNGKRRTVIKQGDHIYALNKTGETRNVEPVLKQALLKCPHDNMIFEAEQIKLHYTIFDLLMIDGKSLANEPYRERMRVAEHSLGSESWCRIVATATTGIEKYALAAQLIKDHAEGVVIKDLNAAYGAGRHKKIKFVKTLDAVVIGPSPKGHDSVELGLYDDMGRLVRIGGCSLRGKEKVQKGDVVEIMYLYSTPTNHVVQPRMTVKRDDKNPEDCKLSQLVLNKNFRK